MDPVFVIIVALSLAILWLTACWHKLAAFDAFAATLSDYRILPRSFVTGAAGLIVAAELIFGASLLVPATRDAGLVASALLLSVYAVAMAVNLLRGRRHIDCGCMGPAARQSLSYWLVLRNLVLAAVALVSSGTLVPRPLVWLDVFTIGAGILVLAIAYEAVNLLISSAPDLAQLRNQA